MPAGYLCLTFDFDALSAWVARGQLTATPRSRGEFAAVAVPRLLRLLGDRGLASTWFIPGHTARTYPDLCREITAQGHEVALHGDVHENVAALPEADERRVLHRSFKTLAEVTGVEPVGFRAPAWDLSDHSVLLLNELGLDYDSSLMAHDHAPYFCRTGDVVDDDGVRWGEPTRLVEVPVSWTLDDFPYLEFLRAPSAVFPGLRDPGEMFASWTLDLAWMLRETDRGVLTVTFHPEVIGRGHRLIHLERWLDQTLSEDVEAVTAARVAKLFRAGEPLGHPRR